MENASKALIMAGAILIAILLISMGVKIFQSTHGMQEPIDHTSKTMAISTFNSQFTNYIGNVNKVQVKNLISKINASNATSDHKISVQYGSVTDINVITSNLNQNKYKVTSTTDANGYINSIKIEDVQ